MSERGDGALRALERLAKQGDTQAQKALAFEHYRRGQVRPVGPCEADAKFLYSGLGDYFGGHASKSGYNIVLYAHLSVGNTWADVVEQWLSDYNERAWDECYEWYNDHPEHDILQRSDLDQFKAPILQFTNDQITLAFIEMLIPPLQTIPLNEIPFEGAPDAGDYVDPECEICEGSGEVYEGGDADVCNCVEQNIEQSDAPVAIVLLEALCDED